MSKPIFIHIPKTGGYTIRKNAPVESYVHHTATEVKKIVKDYSNRFSFAVVRNPYDRLVSAYHFYYQMDVGHPFWHLELDRKVSLAIKAYPTFQNFVLGFGGFVYKHHLHFLPQLHWIYNNEFLVKHVAKFENPNLWEDICHLTKIPYQPLPIINVSEHKPWYAYYTTTLADLVYDIYEKDFEILNYAKYAKTVFD